MNSDEMEHITNKILHITFYLFIKSIEYHRILQRPFEIEMKLSLFFFFFCLPVHTLQFKFTNNI